MEGETQGPAIALGDREVGRLIHLWDLKERERNRVKPHVLFLSHLPGFPAQLYLREAGDGDPSVEGMGLPHCQRCDRRGCFWL